MSTSIGASHAAASFATAGRDGGIEHATLVEMNRAAPEEARRGAVTVSVIIPHYNDLDGLRVCYAKLLSQTWPRADFEIVVADNNSACGMEAVKEIAPGAVVVPALIQGAGPARNAAVAASRGTVLAFLDSDCVPDPNWIHEGVSALGQFDFVGGQVTTFSKDPALPNPIEAFEIIFNFNFRRYIEKVGFTGTGNMFVPRTQFDRVGGFRTGVAEDMEWSFRAGSLGLKLGYAERAIVEHPARNDWAELERRWSRLVDQHHQLALERKLGRAVFVVKALAMPVSIIPHTAKILVSPRLNSMRARFGAIAVLTRLRVWRACRMLRLAAGHRSHAPPISV
jgi:cellulose synthase/poly-beta-1,6-N-acetylglucosamine synthase-like glycosyltransferase